MQPRRPGFHRIRASWVTRCPHLILSPEHYRSNGRCRCDDPNHPMDEWGYQWDDRVCRWLAADEVEHYRRRRRRPRWWRRRR